MISRSRHAGLRPRLCAPGVSLAVRSSVCWHTEREPTKVQYCFGFSAPSHRLMNSLVRTPSPPTRQSTTRSPGQLHPAFHPPFTTGAGGLCDITQQDGPHEICMPDLPSGLAFDRQPDLILQDYWVNPVPALHAAEGLDIMSARILQVVTPFGHEQARTTNAGSRRELLARGKRPNDSSTSSLLHHSAALWLCWLHSPSHDLGSRLLVRCDGLLPSESSSC